MIDPKILKTSRRSFIGTYMLGTFLLLFVLGANIFFGISFLINFFFLTLILMLFLDPEYFVYFRTFYVEKDRIARIKGILQKDRTMIPFESIAHTEMKKSVLGRIFKFGDIVITPFSGQGNEIILRGIRNPDEILKEIEKNVKRVKSKK